MKILLLLATLLTPLTVMAQPNYYIILVDDAGYKDFDRLPNIQRMGAEGIKFTQAWATPMCGPTRASLMTGLHAKSHGVYENTRRPKVSTSIMLANQIPDYNNCVVGKWNTPLNIDEGGWDYTSVWDPASRNTTLHAMEDGRTSSRYYDPAILTNGVLQNGYGQFAPHVFLQNALDFVDSSVADGKNFFVYHSMVLSHGMRNHKYVRPPGYSAVGNAALYKANLREINSIVGEVMAKIREHGNTVLVFATDNPKAREGKTDASVKGCQIAFFMWGPGVVPRRPNVHKPVQLRDMYKTITGVGTAESHSLWDGLNRGKWRQYNLTYFRQYGIAKKRRWEIVAPRHSSNVRRAQLSINGRKVKVNTKAKKRQARKMLRIIKTGK